MSRLLYLDFPSGVSGDMLLAALIDLGVDVDEIYASLNRLPLDPWNWQLTEVKRGGLRSCRIEVSVDVIDSGEITHRRLEDLLTVLESGVRDGVLSEKVASQAEAVFSRIAIAEARVHGESVDSVAFHAVGQSDAVIDVVGVLLAIERLAIDEVWCSPLPLATAGSAKSGHGPVPIPAPATLEILQEVSAPIRSGSRGDKWELVTPTGAALIAEIGTFGRPDFRLKRVGVGAGSRDLEGSANILRALLAETDEVENSTSVVFAADLRRVIIIETTIDDMTAEQVAFVGDQLREAGAIDLWIQPTEMKKGRSGWHVSLIARPEEEVTLVSRLLRDTSTFGVRVRDERRYEALRDECTVTTSLGSARVKLKRLYGEPLQIVPEFDDCARLALEHDLPIVEVFTLIRQAASYLRDE
uniref:Putative nickel insertion protein n=1 Tax=uncultured marine group II/III euryarchaeote AD1000_66_E09 TaxID=1457798 RepID=A0A075FUZ4_9EURY|nr:hypothetical protein [uncultured marine group II/III euryarchaeote AD1000_66_E09]